MSTVVCFGEMLLRLSAPGFDRLFQSPVLTTLFGGSEANVAASLARFGVEVSYVTRLPANAIGDAAIRSLRAEGVRTDHVQRVDGRMGIYFVETGAGQRPSTVIYDRTPSTLSTADAGSVDWDVVLNGATWLHVTGITAALGSGPAACTEAAMVAAKRAGVLVSFDVNYRASLWPPAVAAPVLQRLASHADLLIASEDHFEPLLGIPMARRQQDSRDENADRAAARAAGKKFGARFVASTRRDSHSASRNHFGACLWDSHAGEQLLAVTGYEVDIVDRIGAGDAFAAGLIYALSAARPPFDALRFAVAAGVLKHTIPGDLNRVSVEEVERLMSGDDSGRVRR